MNVRGVIFI